MRLFGLYRYDGASLTPEYIQNDPYTNNMG